jgi:hypothetical protein
MRPVRTAHRLVHAAAERGLAHQRALADWQLAQLRLAEKVVHDAFHMARASLEAGQAAMLAMGRVAVDGLAPRDPS